ncbi:MAG: SoxR reducing system RseC family protein [Planctomycetota bacterium]
MYEQLGNTEGPSIVTKVVLAFLLPLVVFTISLAIFERVFSGVISAGQIQSALSFISALLLTFICILLTKVINRQLNQDS